MTDWISAGLEGALHRKGMIGCMLVATSCMPPQNNVNINTGSEGAVDQRNLAEQQNTASAAVGLGPGSNASVSGLAPSQASTGPSPSDPGAAGTSGSAPGFPMANGAHAATLSGTPAGGGGALSAGGSWGESFQSFSIGDSIPSWGTDLSILKGPDGRNYLSSQIPGRHRAGQRINLGDHFAFEFGWTSFDNRDSGTGAPWVRVPIDLADGSAHVLHVECGNWGLLLPGRPLVDFDESRVNRFRIERRGDDYKFFNNGAFLASGTFAGYGPFVEFQLEVPVTSDGRGQMFTDFRLSRLP